jgi:L-arabinokinase
LHIVFYISGHGFGHASRDIEVINALARQHAGNDIRLSVRTTVARWLFGRAVPSLDIETVETDTGLVQIDSLRFDDIETARRSAAFYDTFDQRAAIEARSLRAMGAEIVIGDIPPLAFAAAARAGIRSVALGNFTWDWIYSVYPAFPAIAPEAIPKIRAAYGTATRALRLPFSGGFEPMAGVTTDIPLVARKSRRDAADTRRLLGADPQRPLVLASFGAYGAPLPWDRIRAASDFALLAVEREPPHGLKYEDLVAAADVVVSKPGYGIVSECIANGTALLYTSRGSFTEYDVLVEEMPRYLRCREVSQEDLLAGRWSDAIAALLAQPAPPEHPRVDGADVAAAAILCS